MNLFAQNFKRNDLISLSKKNFNKEVNINVYRNHSFEPIASIINAFLNLSDLKANFYMSAYDDSLTFNITQTVDLGIIFLDLTRYNNNVDEFITQKIQELKDITNSPVLTILLGDTKLQKYRIEEILKPYISSDLIIDEDSFMLSATKLSNKACIKLAQILGLKIIPSILKPSLKVIICDLDNTLYDGVLGEDGIYGINLTQEHLKLQNQILKLKNNGLMLTIVSKNNECDVMEMFKKRDDFILKRDDFILIKANWENKDKNIIDIGKYLNIGLDSILFIDDNLAEIENVKYLGIKTLHAVNAKMTYDALMLYPCLQSDYISQEDLLRNEDMKANLKRESLKTLTQKEYFAKLDIHLQFSLNKESHLERISQLLNKTNQFIANYSRMNLSQCANFIKNKDCVICSIGMRDILSNSGIIAIVVAKRNDEILEILDFCISCRALGRKLEKIILLKSLDILHTFLNTKKSVLYFKKGDRNLPFLNFLDEIKGNIFENKIEILDNVPNCEGLNIESEI